MWNMKCVIIPVITRTIGIVTKVLKKILDDIAGKHPVDSLEKKTQMLGTSHIIRKVLEYET